MNDLTRKVDPSFSPKSSPRGSRSPMANSMLSRNDSTGTLKMTISAGKHPAVVHSGPFYLMKDPATENELTGATNLMAHFNLEHSYNKFTGKKVRDSLSSFLPTLPGVIDQAANYQNSTKDSSLKSLIDKPPINKEFVLLNHHQLAAFRLQPGPLPEAWRFSNQPAGQRKHKKHKKHKLKPGETPTQDGSADGSDIHEKKHKKKKNDDDKERKKKKKEKKKKKQKHSPEYPGASSSVSDPNRITV